MKSLRTSFPYSERSSLLPVSFWKRALATAAIPLMGAATLRAQTGTVDSSTVGAGDPNAELSGLDYSIGFTFSTSDTRDGEWNFKDSYHFTVNNNSALILGDTVNSDGGTVASGILRQYDQSILEIESGGSLYLGSYGKGTYWFYGGTLKVGGNSLKAGYDNQAGGPGKFFPNSTGAPGGGYDFFFGNGTIETTSAMTTDVDAKLINDSVSTINTTHGDATWKGVIIGAGTLVKTGTGALNLSGNGLNTFRVFDAHQGSTVLTQGSITAGTLYVGSKLPAPSLGAANADFTLEGGDLTISHLLYSLVVGGEPQPSLIVGDAVGDIGLMTQKAGTTATIDGTGAAGAGPGANLTIGAFGGVGTYNLEGGVLKLDKSSLILGKSATGEGRLTMTGGALNLTNGSLMNAGDGLGIITQTGGVITVDAGSTFTPAGTERATYNLTSGTLKIGGESLAAGDNLGHFNLGGGTIETTSDLTTSVNANLVADSFSAIDTTNGNAAWNGNFSGGGALIKNGTGTLTLSGSSRRMGAFAANQGDTVQTAGDTVADLFVVSSNIAGLPKADGAFTLESGTITVSKGQRPQGIFMVGDLPQDNGVMTQKDWTRVNITGTAGAVSDATMTIANSGKGTYHLDGGDINLDNASLILGNSTGADGLLAMKGGSVNLTNGAYLFTREGTGTITQTGGDINVDANSTFIPAGPAGATYNLNTGGRLNIGGTSLAPGANQGHFNLGGGTINTTSALSTSVKANLVAETISTIDTTNGDTAWSGNFSGSGGLVKTGTGTLTLSGTGNQFGGFNAHQGDTVQTAGDTVSSTFLVGSSYAGGLGPADARFTLEGGTITVSKPLAFPSFLGDNSLATLVVGDSGGDTGVMTQKDGTRVNITGTEGESSDATLFIGLFGGKGTYHLGGGEINLNHASLTLGWTAGGEGTLEMEGGRVNLTNGSYLFTGDGTGILTQTGGVINVDATSTFFPAGPTGATYHLNTAGTLKIGGTSLDAGANLGHFNLGGGRIETNSALTTELNANLVADTVSTLDTTNGDAAWSGNFSGPGGLMKTGTGTLMLSGTGNQFGGFNAHKGDTVQTAGDTVTGTFLIGSSYKGAGADGLGPADARFTLEGGTLSVSNPVAFPAFEGMQDAVLLVGEESGDIGVMTQKDGTKVNITGTGGGQPDANLYIGGFGGKGTYHLEAGDLNLDNASLILGYSPGADGTLEMKGGTLNLTNGTLMYSGTGKGVITQTGGIIDVDSTSYFTPANTSAATYNLNTGGRLRIGSDSLGADANLGHFNLGGGTLETNSALTTAVNATLVADTVSTLDTTNGDAAWSGNFSGSGGLVKTGTGTLTLSGTGNQFGGFKAHQGDTVQTAGDTVSNTFLIGSSYVDAGAAGLGAAAAGFTLESGTITIAKPLASPGFRGLPNAAFLVGDKAGDTGVMTQKDWTRVNITGTAGEGIDAYMAIGNGGKGIYHLDGGDINLDNASLLLGITPGADGLLEMKGGSVNLSHGAYLSTGAGTGTITQTGGDINVEAGSVFIPAGPAGATYNLNTGGRLTIGGNSLVADANLGHFNLGGGTIVTTSPMTTAVNATLVAGTVSTIDTTGGDAAWSGNLSGDGGLNKIRSGTLTLSGKVGYTGTTTVSDSGSTLRLRDAFSGGSLASATGANRFEVNAGASLILEQNETIGTFGRNVQGNGQLQVLGGGNLTLTGTNTHTGGTIIGDPVTPGGIVTVNNASQLGAGSGEVIVNKSTLNILGDGAVIGLSIGGGVSGGSIRANGSLVLGGAGHGIDTRASINAAGFDVYMFANDVYEIGSQSASVRVGGITLATGGRVIAPSRGMNVLSDGLAGTPSAVIRASGSASIEGKVVAGHPLQPGDPVNGDDSGHVLIQGPTASGEQLRFTGPLFGNYIITGNTSLAAGSSPGFSAGLGRIGSPGMSTHVDQNSPLVEVWGTDRGTNLTGYDATDVVEGDLNYSGVITVTFAGGSYSPAAGDIFDLVRLSDSGSTFTASGATFNFAGAPLPGGLSWDTSDFFNNANGDLKYTIAVVPETSASTLLLLSAAAGLAARRRR